MDKLVILSVFILVSSNFVKVSEGGTVAYKHRDTTLGELRDIDNYVASWLPVLQDGFFIDTARGPVLVKSEPHPGANKRPVVRQKYYNTLPRLIPKGFEGIATSHFNLGAASHIQPFSLSKNLVRYPSPVQAHQYVASQVPQPSEQYAPQPVVEQPQQQFYQTQDSQPQQYVAEAQQSQQYLTHHHPQEHFNQPEETQPVQQQYHQYDHHPQQYLRQVSSPQQQQYIPEQDIQQQQYISEQDIGDLQQQHIPQESVQITSRNQFPDAQPSFQVDNLLRPEQDPPQATAYQTQSFGEERFNSQKLIPNSAVVATTEFEETLPEPLRNRFYKSANLATLLEQESLPVQGEQIVGEWDTHKIAKGKIHALLLGAGLI